MGGIGSNTLYGTLNLLVLKTLAGGELHGLEVARRIFDTSGETLEVEEGALYPALHRLERDGLVESEWGISEARRRARFYRLTAEGRKRLQREIERWAEHASGVAAVLDLEEGWSG